MWGRAIGCIVTLRRSLLVASLATEAQPGGKRPRLGVLTPGIPPQPRVEAFRQGLRDLGSLEGQTVARKIR
jgi:putative ABC transport system substrate-binding protein